MFPIPVVFTIYGATGLGAYAYASYWLQARVGPVHMYTDGEEVRSREHDVQHVTSARDIAGFDLKIDYRLWFDISPNLSNSGIHSFS